MRINNTWLALDDTGLEGTVHIRRHRFESAVSGVTGSERHEEDQCESAMSTVCPNSKLPEWPTKSAPETGHNHRQISSKSWSNVAVFYTPYSIDDTSLSLIKWSASHLMNIRLYFQVNDVTYFQNEKKNCFNAIPVTIFCVYPRFHTTSVVWDLGWTQEISPLLSNLWHVSTGRVWSMKSN